MTEPGEQRSLALREALQEHARGPLAGEVRETLRLLDDPGDPFDHDRYDPGHVTAGGLVLSPTRGEVLLILHRIIGEWIEPGGHVDPGDADVPSAAFREVTEETGISGLTMLPGILDVGVHPIPPHGSRPPHKHFNVVYGFTAVDPTLAPSQEVAAARWVRLDEVRRLTEDDAVLRGVAALRSMVDR